MKARAHVRLDKLSTENEGYLPTGYYCKGRLTEDIELDRPIQLDRYERARQSADEPEVVVRRGQYTSSPVQFMRPDGDSWTVAGASWTIQTMNSHWRVTILPDSA